MNGLPPYLYGIGWLFLSFWPLLILQRWLHREIQAILLILTRRSDFTIGLFSLLFLPGVVLHETSHFIMARILGVRTGKVSLLPRPLPNGKLQLGYVETAQADWLREAMIGAAPLMTGSLCIAFAGINKLGMGLLWTGWQLNGLGGVIQAVGVVYDQPDFWLWFYFIFTISSTMLPSESDRRAWLPLLVIVGIALLAGLVIGVGPWMVDTLAPPLDQFFRAMAVVFSISGIIHLILLAPAFGVRSILSSITGLKVT